uniref:alpha-L-rhamnosidase-related protein n=1 Tax=Prevotella sp. TaxID=59823 RepID=UPI004025D841
MQRILTIIVTFLCTLTSFAQFPAPTEGWIAVPGASREGYGVYVFQRDISLSTIAEQMRVWVSGDNRYKLFVNGKIVSIGPARSDVKHWNCEEVDLAPYLQTGSNTVTALVWNEGTERPAANMTYRTGFFLHAIDKAADIFNTNKQWRCREDKSYRPISVSVPGYYAAGPGERRDMHLAIAIPPTGQQTLNTSSWQQATVISGANYIGQAGAFGTYPGWMLKRSTLPLRELRTERMAVIRQNVNVKADNNFLKGKAPITIPAHTTAKIILDNKVETNAYVTLKFSGGDNSRIALGYTEAFYDALPRNFMETPTKGNRNDIEGKMFIGRTDTIISNGQQGQEFTTLMWRTYRYIVLTVTTANEALTLDDLYGTFTGYPFQQEAHLSLVKGSAGSKQRRLNDDIRQIFDIGWRTARLCAIETYMDCPYYEQMQYFGDSRIQALVTLFMTGDDRLVKQLLDAGDWSRDADGVTQSRYPASIEQWIQPYALHYIYTLHDYMMYANDTTFLKSKLMTERTILDYFHRYQLADGRVKDLPGWNFTDWVDHDANWQAGVAMPGADGCNAVMDLQLLYAYQMAADLEAHIGMKAYARLYAQRAEQLQATIRNRYWRQQQGLFSDRSDKDVFSQHANALAILTGVVDGTTALSVARHIETGSIDNNTKADKVLLAPASIYFKFYTHQAMTKAGLGDDYMDWLGIWRRHLHLGLTTCGETSDVNATRSDCHAWGASPNIEFFRTVLGIDSDAPCFSHVVIRPHLGSINKIGGTMPTPYGNITVSYERRGNSLSAVITLPDNISGNLMWNGKNYPLHGGQNIL